MREGTEVQGAEYPHVLMHLAFLPLDASILLRRYHTGVGV